MTLPPFPARTSLPPLAESGPPAWALTGSARATLLRRFVLAADSLS